MSRLLRILALLLATCSLKAQDTARHSGGTDTVKPVTQELQTVTVRSARTRIVMRPDGFLYQANNTIPVAGEKAADVLRRLPGVIVDPDGVPTLNGSNRIKVLIDGKPSDIFAATVGDALRQIPSEHIATIEVITHPSAKYEAEGVDGVILITTRQPSQNATSATIELTMGDRISELEGNLVAKRNKWVLKTDVDLYRRSLYVLADTYREGAGALAGTGLQQERNTQIRAGNENATINLIYLADSLRNWNLQYRATWDRSLQAHRYDNRLYSGSQTDSFIRAADNPLRRQSHSFGLGYTQKTKDKKTEYNFLLTGSYQPINNGYQSADEKDGAETYRENDRYSYLYQNLGGQFDLLRLTGGRGKLEAGGRLHGLDLRIDNRIGVFDYPQGTFVPDMVRSSSFAMRHAIAAAYASYSYPLGDYTLRAGLRYEYTYWALRIADSGLAIPSYGNWLPNVLISRTLGSSQTISASYSQKIQRPYFVYLNPLVNYLDSLNIEHGNPYLKPALIHQYSLSYTYRWDRLLLNTSLGLVRSIHNIEYVRTLQPGGITEATWLNVSSNTTFSTAVNFSYQGKHFSFSLNNVLQSVAFQTDGTVPERKGLVFSSGGTFSYVFDHGYTLTAYTNFNTPTITLQGSTTGRRWYNFLVDKSFREGKFHIGARVDNFFSHYQYITETTSATTFHQQIRTRNIYRFFYLNLSYRFGRKEVVMPATRSASQEN